MIYPMLYLFDCTREPRLIVCLWSPASQWFLKRFAQDLKNKDLHVGTSISNLNAQYSKVKLTPQFTSTVLFTLHPNDRYTSNKSVLQYQFLEVFKRLAKMKIKEKRRLKMNIGSIWGTEWQIIVACLGTLGTHLLSLVHLRSFLYCTYSRVVFCILYSRR